MQNNIGEFLKEVIVNQGFMIKDFAKEYKTTPTHMSDILSKKDISTKIFRIAEPILGVKFKIISSLNEESNTNEESSPLAKVKQNGNGGRPITFKQDNKKIEFESLNTANTNIYLKEIEGLKALLSSKEEVIKSKDQIIKSKDDLIQTLIANKI